jgi:hypothetical protein
MKVWRAIQIGSIVIVIFLIAIDMWVTIIFRDRLYDYYTRQLDAWVASGGPQNKIQSEVIPNCSKLVISQAGPIGAPLLVLDRSDYDFKSDVCFQVTVNRVYPQPRFENAAMVSLVCDSKIDLFRKLCRHSALKVH